MAKPKSHFTCQSCGHQAPKWLGRCPECSTWGSLVEETEAVEETRPAWGAGGASEKPVKLSEVLREKKLVLINFWATWCGPCRVEMPSFEQLFNEQKNEGFTILAIAEDKDRAKVDQYLEGKPVSFPVLLDPDNALGKQFKIESLPTTVLVDGNGRIQEVHQGVDPYLKYTVQATLSPHKRP
jgi:thiol-disulfide isomerase/thioredoxin